MFGVFVSTLVSLLESAGPRSDWGARETCSRAAANQLEIPADSAHAAIKVLAALQQLEKQQYMN